MIEIIFPALEYVAPNYAIAPLLALAGVQTLLGGIKYLTARKEIRKLDKEKEPEFYETAEMRDSRNRAGQMAQSGFTPAENAAFQQQLARSQNTAYRRGVDTAPNMASAINAGINYTNIGAINQHATNDAQLHRQNIRYHDTFSDKLQGIADKNVAQQITNRNYAYQQLGEGAQAGMQMIGSGLNFAALAAGGIGGGSGAPAGATPPINSVPLGNRPPSLGAVNQSTLPAVNPFYDYFYNRPANNTQPPMSDSFSMYGINNGIPRE